MNNYGYDFDGVLHVTVELHDEFGQRNPKEGHSLVPFDEIINQISNQLDSGDNVYIITARHEQDSPIGSFLSQYNIKIPKQNVRYTSGQDKTSVLQELQIAQFYDDSRLRINELYESKLNGLLPNLRKLYFVNPEVRSWTQVIEK
jgi:hypothetical protein